MDSSKIHTLTDMTEAIGNSISERDIKACDLAERVLNEMRVPVKDHLSMMTLISAAREAIWALVENEERSAA